ncbi:MAG: hypothetical protein QW115_07150, partial [Thermoplasmata archaeon]
LDFSPATTSFQVLPSIGYTNTTGVATFNVRVVSEIPSNTTFNVTAYAGYGTLSAKANGTLVVRKGGGEISVSLELSRQEVEGVTGAEVLATVCVNEDTAPLADVDVSLLLSPETGLSAEAGKKTDANGTARIKITLTGDFSADTVVHVKAIAVVNGMSHESTEAVLTVRQVSYLITLTLEPAEVAGNEGNSVNATVRVLRGTAPVSGANVSLAVAPNASIEISPGMGQTDENGTAGFRIRLTANFTEDTEVLVKSHAVIRGIEYNGSSAVLKIRGVSSGYDGGYEITLTLEPAEIVGKKGREVKAVITVRRNGTGVPALNVTVAFERAGLSATEGVTDQNGTAVVKITVVEEFREAAVIKVIPVVNGKSYPENGTALKIEPVPVQTPGFEVWMQVIAIALLALMLARKKLISG